MVRTLTPRTKKGQRLLLIPGSTAAEPWELWTVGADSECLKAGQRPQDLAQAQGTTLALPASQVMALPIWLQETRPAEFPDMIALQVEGHGLQRRSQDAVFNWSIIARENSRTLVLVGVLASLLPEDIETTAFATFDLSVRCWPLPADAIVFSLEHDRLVMAITRGDQLAYFHALTESVFSDRVLQDVTCIVASLRMQGVIEQPTRLMVCAEGPIAGAEKLGPLLSLNPEQETALKPQVPVASWQLTPARVGATKRARRARGWQVRLVLLLTFLVVGVFIALGARFSLAAREVTSLQEWQSVHAADVDRVHSSMATWKDLQPALDTSAYPLEILLHVSEALPDQVHFTLFDLEGNHLLIRAEAKNLTAGFNFFDRLKKDPNLSGYTWDMSQPHLLGNDITQLQLEGTYAPRD